MPSMESLQTVSWNRTNFVELMPPTVNMIFDFVTSFFSVISFFCSKFVAPFGGNRPQSDAQAPAGGALNTNEVSSNAANPPAQAAASPTTSAPNLLANVINNFNNLATSILPRPTAAPAADAAAAAPAQQTQAQTGTRGDQAAAQAQATTQAPNIISNIATNVQNALNNIATGLFQRTTTATPAAAPAATSPAPTVVKGTRVDDEEVEVVQNIDIVNDKIDLTKKGQ